MLTATFMLDPASSRVDAAPAGRRLTTAIGWLASIREVRIEARPIAPSRALWEASKRARHQGQDAAPRMRCSWPQCAGELRMRVSGQSKSGDERARRVHAVPAVPQPYLARLKTRKHSGSRPDTPGPSSPAALPAPNPPCLQPASFQRAANHGRALGGCRHCPGLVCSAQRIPTLAWEA